MSRRSAVRRSVVVAWALIIFAMCVEPAMEAQVRWGRPRVPRAGACFYRDANFRGDYFCAGVGEDISALPDGMNDQISSIRTFGSSEVTVFQNGRFGGRSAQFTSEVRNLREAGWNDRLSSLRVRNGFGDGRPGFGAVRNGDERRFDRDADRIVRRAYQDILDREPDTAGLRFYRSRILDDDWTEDQVRDALRDSPEYRERTTMTRAKAEEIVRQAYLSVLNREPDAGARVYVENVLRRKWTEQDVVRELRKSPEFRNR